MTGEITIHLPPSMAHIGTRRYQSFDPEPLPLEAYQAAAATFSEVSVRRFVMGFLSLSRQIVEGVKKTCFGKWKYVAYLIIDK